MSGITNFLCRPTGAEVVALCETVTNKNFVTDAEKTQIGIDSIQTAAQVKAAVESFTAGDRITLDNFQEGSANKVFSAAEETKLGNINLGASAATGTEIVALVEAAGTLTADAVVDGTTNKMLTDTERGQLTALVAATPQFELFEETFDLAVSAVWVDAIPVGSVLIELKYINLTAIGETGAASYKINLTGGVTADLESGIAFAQNTKKVVGIAETAIPASTDVNLTANAGSLDSGSVKVGLLIRKASENYPDVV